MILKTRSVVLAAFCISASFAALGSEGLDKELSGSGSPSGTESPSYSRSSSRALILPPDQARARIQQTLSKQRAEAEAARIARRAKDKELLVQEAENMLRRIEGIEEKLDKASDEFTERFNEITTRTAPHNFLGWPLTATSANMQEIHWLASLFTGMGASRNPYFQLKSDRPNDLDGRAILTQLRTRVETYLTILREFALESKDPLPSLPKNFGFFLVDEFLHTKTESIPLIWHGWTDESWQKAEIFLCELNAIQDLRRAGYFIITSLIGSSSSANSFSSFIQLYVTPDDPRERQRAEKKYEVAVPIAG